MGKVFRKAGADADRICTWVSLMAAVISLVCACLSVLWPVLLWVPLAVILVCGALYLIWRMPSRLIDLAASALIALTALITEPFNIIAACVVFGLFLILMGAKIADAYLPVRAYRVRKSAQKR